MAAEGSKKCLAPFYIRNYHKFVIGTAILLVFFPLYAGPPILLFLMLTGSPRSLGRRSFARLMTDFTPEYNDMAHEHKLDHFRSLPGTISADSELRQKGKFRLLELGVGGGANFEYYPDNCVLVGMDNNPAMEPHFRASIARRKPPLELEAFHVNTATDMKQIPDNSIDVIVTTMVLCYIPEYDPFFAEILRVLAPGGKYYFWENVQDPNPRSAQHAFQKLLEPVMYQTCDRARTTKRIWKEFENRQEMFGELQWQHFTLEPRPNTSVVGSFLVWFVQGSNIRGFVTKKCGPEVVLL